MRYEIPAYSQYLDVKNRAWKRRSCGIVALKMAMDYYEPRRAAIRSIPRLIKKGMRMHAYVRNVGWSHRGLAHIAETYSFRGKNYDWWKETPRRALTKLNRYLGNGPVLASVYRDLRPNAHGHLVVIAGLEKGTIYYYNPDSRTKSRIARHASLKKFLRGWKRRIIVIRPPSRTLRRVSSRLHGKK
ncbi:MAG: C39 family peptidase [Deltaproteobacteria bacterium]|nr:C39 family peptidase [Deltaproteobacteria bacterium]